MNTFLIVDTQTWTITILGWFIVFIALLFLVGIFLIVPKIVNWFIKRKLRKKGKIQAVVNRDKLSGEINAAIATALFMYFSEVHDEESNILTIKKIQRRYSPWSSKIYGMSNAKFKTRR